MLTLHSSRGPSLLSRNSTRRASRSFRPSASTPPRAYRLTRDEGCGQGRRDQAQGAAARESDPGPGPQSVKPVGGAEAAGFDDGNVEAKKRKKLGKLSKKRKAKGAPNDDADDAPAAAAKKKSKKSAVDAAHKSMSKRHVDQPDATGAKGLG